MVKKRGATFYPDKPLTTLRQDDPVTIKTPRFDDFDTKETGKLPKPRLTRRRYRAFHESSEGVDEMGDAATKSVARAQYQVCGICGSTRVFPRDFPDAGLAKCRDCTERHPDSNISGTRAVQRMTMPEALPIESFWRSLWRMLTGEA